MRLPFQRPRPPSLSAVAEYYELSERERFYSNGGPCYRLLCERVQELLGVVEVVPVANATIGLEVLLTALKPDRRSHVVAMPSFSFPATALCASRMHDHPLFVDIDPQTWQVDLDQLGEALSSQDDPAVIMACTTFGTPPTAAYFDRLAELGRRHGAPVIVDAAAALAGICSDGGLFGAQPDHTVFSLHVTKTAATSEGGLIVTSSPSVAERMRRLVNFGFDDNRAPAEPDATNGKLSEIAAAFALAALDGLADAIKHRRSMAAHIRSSTPDDLVWQDGVERSTIQFISVALPAGVDRECFTESLARSNIETRRNFSALHLAPAFRSETAHGTLDITLDLSARIVSLPMYSDMTDDEVDCLINGINAALGP